METKSITLAFLKQSFPSNQDIEPVRQYLYDENITEIKISEHFIVTTSVLLNNFIYYYEYTN